MPMRADPLRVFTRINSDIDRLKSFCQTEEEKRLYSEYLSINKQLIDLLTTPEKRGLAGSLNKRNAYEIAGDALATYYRASQMSTDQPTIANRWQEFVDAYNNLTPQQSEFFVKEHPELTGTASS